MQESRVANITKITSIHGAVFLIMLGVCALISYWFLPIQDSAVDVFKWGVSIFVIYLGVFTLIQFRSIKRRSGRRAR
jgi:glucan phosphoethanolaminetransferase (alkaline phosphatase superfamily)